MYMNYSSNSKPLGIVSGVYGDVNGDGINDYIFLSAVKADPSSPYLEEISLHILNGRTHATYNIPLSNNGNSGYHPTDFLGDFTKDGIMDILVSIDSGGSGAYTFNYVYSFVSNQARKLFDFNQYNEQNQYTVIYLDNYKVRVKSPSTSQSFLIDMSDRSTDYLAQIYHDDGILKKPVQGIADGVSGFYPVDVDRNGVYEIQAYQMISGLYHADSLGYIINTLQWDGHKFSIWQQWLAIFGTENEKD